MVRALLQRVGQKQAPQRGELITPTTVITDRLKYSNKERAMSYKTKSFLTALGACIGFWILLILLLV